MAQIITGAEFEEKVLKSNDTVLIDFYADWCGPCKMMGPVLDELSGELSENQKIYKINVDSDGALAASYKIALIPSLLFFKNGEVCESITGLADKETLKGIFDKL